MSKKRFSPLLISTVFAAVAPAVQGQGLTNADFEMPGAEGQTPTGWVVEKGKFFLDPVKRSSGNFAGKLDGGDQVAVAYQDVAVLPGTVYQLSGQWRNGDRTADFDILYAEVRWLSAPGGEDLGQAVVADSGRVVSQWEPFYLNAVTAPPNAGAARILLKSRFGIGAFDGLQWGPARGGAPGATASADAAPAQTAPASRPPASASQSIPPLTQVLAANPPRSTSPPPLTGGAPASPVPGNSSAASAGLPVLKQTSPSSSSAAASNINWMTDLRQARRSAAAEQKKILLFFSGNDAAAARDEASVFGDPRVAGSLGGFVPVRIDFERSRSLAAALRVSNPGTVTFYDSRGEFLAQVEPPATADAVLQKLQDLK